MFISCLTSVYDFIVLNNYVLGSYEENGRNCMPLVEK